MRIGLKKTIKYSSGSYFLTMTVVEWVDIFTRKRYADIVLDTLRFCIKNKGLHVYAYVIMSNHLHIIVNCDSGHKLEDIIRDFKKFSSKTMMESIRREPESRREWLVERFSKAAREHTKSHQFKIWQDGNFAIELYSERFTWTKIRYIHLNPVRAGLVKEETHWVYSSATNYQEMDSILKEVDCLAPPLLRI